ncbi:act minimal PKS chain-length factor (CLF/KS beta) [Amycolatopsis xylanica]|uniref:Act minimal PKS chain-length factor (CLF/KS beta) n=2 Tax=Amycolatopsis xylanica TaxID=589385 RepID=A0A1H3RUD5_9PSEU|nr:ketosynthase chain-length factor [Amycolatopsis xylanica]SDZ29304.1 act minimal PKS chain-length factor (CLF/KS beta) [Amycolatopsis xylanica]
MKTIVTGLSVAAPNGLGVEDYWSATLAGRGGIGRLTRFDPSRYAATLAGEVTGFDAAEHLPGRLLPQTDPMTRLSLASAAWALEDAGIEETGGGGVVTASTGGGFEFGQRELGNLWSKGPKHVSAYQSFAWFYAVNSGQISIREGLRGPSSVLVSDQAGGLDALGHARRQIRGGTPFVVSGAVDGALCPWGWVSLLASGRVSTSADPERAYLPFDTGAAGHVPGEGGAILVLESEETAGERGYGELAGYAATFGVDAYRRVIELALADAGESTVDVVFADAAAVPELDLAEAEAITAVLGTVPVTAPKTMTGRLYAGGGALDVASALLAIRDGVIPPTTNVTNAYDLDLVTMPRPAPLRTALVLARGQGGFNSAILLRRKD